MKKAIISLIVLSLAFSSFGLDGIDQSPTQDVTGVFSEPVDQYTDVIDFTELDSSVLFLQFDSPEKNDYPFTIGLGHQLSDFLYLGGNLTLWNLGVNETTSSSLSSTPSTPGSYIDQSRTDTVTDSYYSSKNAGYYTEVLAGLNLGAMALGVKLDFVYQDDEEVNGDSAALTIGALNALPSVTTSTGNSKTTTSYYDSEGNLVTQSVDNITDGYVRGGQTLGYGLDAGTTLNAGNFAIEVRLNADMSSDDNSISISDKDHTTNFETALATYQGVENAAAFNSKSYDKVDVSNDLSVGLLGTTKLPILASFELESGLGYQFSTTFYQDGGVSESFDEVNYTSNTNGAYVETSTTTKNYEMSQDYSNTGHSVTVPVVFNSKFSEVFNVSIANYFNFGLSSTETSSTYSTTENTVTTSTDSTVEDYTYNRTRDYVGSETTSSNVTFRDNIVAGAKFFITEKFRINVGSTVTMQPVYLSTSESKSSGIATETVVETVDGEETVTSTNLEVQDPYYATNSASNSATQSSVSFDAGFTYFANENLTLDLKYTSLAANSSSDIWSLGNWELLLTAKY